MVLQDLGRRINAAVSDLTRSSNLDEKVSVAVTLTYERVIDKVIRHSMA